MIRKLFLLYWRYLALLAFVGIVVGYYNVHVDKLVDKAVTANDAKWEAKQAKANNDFEAEKTALRAEILAKTAEQQAAADALRASHDAALKSLKADYDKRLANLHKEISATADAACRVPVGLIVHATRAVASANGKGELEGQDLANLLPGFSNRPLDADSGIPLSDFGGWLDQFAQEAGDCRAEVKTWRNWYPEQKRIFEQ